jgi:hypothetical protein
MFSFSNVPEIKKRREQPTPKENKNLKSALNHCLYMLQLHRLAAGDKRFHYPGR